MFRDRVEPASDAAELLAHLAAATRAITAASATDPFEQVVATILVDAAHAVGADHAAVWVERDDAIAVIATTGLQATTVDRFHRFDVPPETPAKSTLRQGVPITWTTPTSARHYFPHIPAQDFGSGFVSPLRIGGQYAGVLFIGWATEQRRLRVTERSFLEAVTHMCAIAIQHPDRPPDRPDDSDYTIGTVGETFAITVTASDIETVMWVAGEIDVSNLDRFAQCLQDVTENYRNERLVLDLTDVEFLSVAAARLMLHNSQHPSRPDTTIELRSASPSVQLVFDVVSTI